VDNTYTDAIDRDNQFNRAKVELASEHSSMQVFNSPNSEPFQHLEVKRLMMVGGGAQAKVYKVRVHGFREELADKFAKIVNNDDLAKKKLTEMYNEYLIAKDLYHPNIVETKYFMRKFDIKSHTHEFHIIMELVNGIDMQCYLKEVGIPDIEIVRNLGK